MNMKRIVFAAVGILIMLVIMFFSIYTINHIDEINQRRRDKKAGEELASQLITTTATTSIWDALRPTETETLENSENSDNPENTGGSPTEAVSQEEPSESPFAETASIPQGQTETAIVTNFQ